jgi:hypothetical protein
LEPTGRFLASVALVDAGERYLLVAGFLYPLNQLAGLIAIPFVDRGDVNR